MTHVVGDAGGPVDHALEVDETDCGTSHRPLRRLLRRRRRLVRGRTPAWSGHRQASDRAWHRRTPAAGCVQPAPTVLRRRPIPLPPSAASRSPPGEVLGGKLARHGLGGGGVHAALPEHLSVGAGRGGRDGGVGRAVDLRLRRRALPAERARSRWRARRARPRSSAPAAPRGARECWRGREPGGGAKDRGVGLVGEHDQEHVLDRRQLARTVSAPVAAAAIAVEPLPGPFRRLPLEPCRSSSCRWSPCRSVLRTPYAAPARPLPARAFGGALAVSFAPPPDVDSLPPSEGDSEESEAEGVGVEEVGGGEDSCVETSAAGGSTNRSRGAADAERVPSGLLETCPTTTPKPTKTAPAARRPTGGEGEVEPRGIELREPFASGPHGADPLTRPARARGR